VKRTADGKGQALEVEDGLDVTTKHRARTKSNERRVAATPMDKHQTLTSMVEMGTLDFEDPRTVLTLALAPANG
jgi:hypothetical protein